MKLQIGWHQAETKRGIKISVHSGRTHVGYLWVHNVAQRVGIC